MKRKLTVVFMIFALMIMGVDGWFLYNMKEVAAEEKKLSADIKDYKEEITELEEELAKADQMVIEEMEKRQEEQGKVEQAAEQAAVEAEQAEAEQEAEEAEAVFSENEIGIHTYEYCIADRTWEEAYRNAVEMGGYLVHINSVDEYEYILEEIYAYGYEDCQFMIGGRRALESQDYYWVNEEGNLSGTELNGANYWAINEWYPGEPSYKDGEIIEDCMNFYFNKDMDQWVWNDIPNDVLAVAPNFSGKIGYIVEYDN